MSALLKLSGMAYHGGKPVAHWLALTGVDATTVTQVRVHNGNCYWTPAAERIVRAHFENVRANHHAIGVNHR